ncbi:MAG: hypothetical protein M5U26_19545 [Planctomycetota bacterium]|nr:hypothetical protein [Planctomycetota bacterium]
MPEGPEDKARKLIDRQLEACGWTVQDHRVMNITTAPGFPHPGTVWNCRDKDYQATADRV